MLDVNTDWHSTPSDTRDLIDLILLIIVFKIFSNIYSINKHINGVIHIVKGFSFHTVLCIICKNIQFNLPDLVSFHRGCSRMLTGVDIITNLLSYVLHLGLDQNRHELRQTATLRQER